MVKKFTAGIMMAAILFTSVPVMAVQADTIDSYSKEELRDNIIGYEEVSDLVHTYNKTVINNRYSYEDLEDNYDDDDDADESPTGPSVDTSQIDKAIEYYAGLSAQQQAVIDNPESTEEQKAAAMQQKMVYDNTITSLGVQKQSYTSMGAISAMMSSSGGSISDTELRTYNLQFRQAEAQIVKSVQSLFPSYYQLINNLEQLKANRDLLQATHNAKMVQLSLGMCTQADVTEAENNVASLDYNITALQSQIITMKQEICKLIGKPYNTDIVLGEMPEVDFAYIRNMNLEKDIDTAIQNNYSVKMLQYKRNDISNGASYETKDTADNNLEVQRETVRSSVSQQYQTVLSNQNTLELEQKKLEQMKTTMQTAETKYNMGLMSNLEYESQKVNYTSQEIAVKNAELTLSDSIQAYQWYLKGL